MNPKELSQEWVVLLIVVHTKDEFLRPLDGPMTTIEIVRRDIYERDPDRYLPCRFVGYGTVAYIEARERCDLENGLRAAGLIE